MIKLCECGCRQPTEIIKNTDKRRGRVKGEYRRFINGHQNRDENNSMYGKHHTEAAKELNRQAHLGKHSVNEFKKGKAHPNYGKTSGMKGKHLSKERRDKMRLNARWGKNNPNWKGGITPLYDKIRRLPEYKEWRTSIYERDNYTCQKCGSQKSGTFNAHHNDKQFIELFREFLQEYNQFSPFEDQHTLLRLAMKWQPFWTAEGITYCDNCHTLKHKEISNASGKAINGYTQIL